MNDHWKEWILTHRQSGGENYQKALEEFFIPLREKLLDRAQLKEAETLLDVGTGDGLVAFGALGRVGENGKVIFSDISDPLLELCRTAAKDLGVADRCEFRLMSADRLDLADASVDVVTTRSVLIYLEDKKKCLEEFYRVLNPGGRLSLFEPIADVYMSLGRPNNLMGLELNISDEILHKIAEGRRSVNNGKDSTLFGFDERDFFRWADECGFAEIDIELQLTKRHKPAPPIEHFLHVRPNPLASTLDEIMHAVLSKDERRDLRNAMNKAILNGVTDYMALMFFTATKS
jgi:ubiquinone/menaquinone biosynthesis C-methylase UbiE